MNKIDDAVRDIRQYFRFLFERGYQIDQAEYFPGLNQSWIVTLHSAECKIRIESDRNHISLEFMPLNGSANERIDLKSMIYLVTDGKVVVPPFKGNLYRGRHKQLRRIAELTREYFERILPYFAHDFETHRSDLLLAQERYNQAA